MFENLALAIPYQCLMLYGIFGLVSHWGHDSTRGISGPLYLVFGVIVPVTGWLISTLVPAAFFVIPCSLGFLVASTRRGDQRDRRSDAVLREEDRDAAYRMIVADAANAAGYWALGKAFEAERHYEAALQQYRRAHELSDRTISVPEMKDISERLEDAIAFDKAKAKDAGGHVRLEPMLFAAGLLLAWWNWVFALNVCSVMAFLSWFRGRPV